jgi:Tfp pilus assembly protein PilO
MISRAIWLARHRLQQLGWPGMLALGLFTFCLAFYLSALLPARQKLHALEQDTTMLRARMQPSTKPVRETEAGGPEAQLAAFYKAFPSNASTPDLLQKIHRAAASGQIRLDQGAYRLVADHDGRLQRYQITLPLKGSYPQIKTFLARVMQDLPTLALDSISFQRQNIADPLLDAQVRLTLYLGGAR